jgi:GAF domain-containing protein
VTPSDADDPTTTAQQAFDELGRMSFAEHSLDSLLHKVTDLAARVIPGEPHTSLTIIREKGPRTAASSGQMALDLDLVQYRLGSGPCLEAATTGHPVEITDTQAETRWPEFAQAAGERGCGSVLSYPLPPQERLSGGLNLYSSAPRTADSSTRQVAERFAAYAAVSLSNLYLYRTAVERADNLAAALDSRAVIDQAKGILMERFRMTADQAFGALARVSMESNMKVREVAERFVNTGELPQG